VIFSIFGKKDFTSLSDESLMLHIAKGNSEAFNELYKRYGVKLYNYFLRMLNKNKSKAEDFTQDLFIKVMQTSAQFNTDKKLSPWLYTMANNMCRNEWRDQSNRTAILKQLTMDEVVQHNFHQKIDQKLLNQKLEDELVKLQEDDQLLLTMRYQQELSIQEIAVVLLVPEGTVKSRLFYLMKKLSIRLNVFSKHYN